MTVRFCLVCPDPLHDLQGLEMTDPRPPQRRQVERITKGPVLTVSYHNDKYTGMHLPQCLHSFIFTMYLAR